jgi:hypothetical protein
VGSNGSIAHSSSMLKSVSSPLLARSTTGGYLASKRFHDHGNTVLNIHYKIDLMKPLSTSPYLRWLGSF